VNGYLDTGIGPQNGNMHNCKYTHTYIHTYTRNAHVTSDSWQIGPKWYAHTYRGVQDVIFWIEMCTKCVQTYIHTYRDVARVNVRVTV